MAGAKRHRDVPQGAFFGKQSHTGAPPLNRRLLDTNSQSQKKENPAEAGFSITTAVKTISSEA